jgi:hypothetical protein
MTTTEATLSLMDLAGAKAGATPSGQPAGGLRPEPLPASQPVGAHQAQGEGCASVDFDKLRAERDAVIESIAQEMWAKLGGDPSEAPTFHCRDHHAACYCACGAGGPCEPDFSGWRDLLDDDDQPCGGEQFCQRCGEGAMSHSMRFSE